MHSFLFLSSTAKRKKGTMNCAKKNRPKYNDCRLITNKRHNSAFSLEALHCDEQRRQLWWRRRWREMGEWAIVSTCRSQVEKASSVTRYCYSRPHYAVAVVVLPVSHLYPRERTAMLITRCALRKIFPHVTVLLKAQKANIKNRRVDYIIRVYICEYPLQSAHTRQRFFMPCARTYKLIYRRELVIFSNDYHSQIVSYYARL